MEVHLLTDEELLPHAAPCLCPVPSRTGCITRSHGAASEAGLADECHVRGDVHARGNVRCQVPSGTQGLQYRCTSPIGIPRIATGHVTATRAWMRVTPSESSGTCAILSLQPSGGAGTQCSGTMTGLWVGLVPRALLTRAVLQSPDFSFFGTDPQDHQPATTNRQPPTATNRQPPTAIRQPPPFAKDCGILSLWLCVLTMS